MFNKLAVLLPLKLLAVKRSESAIRWMNAVKLVASEKPNLLLSTHIIYTHSQSSQNLIDQRQKFLYKC